MIGNKWGIERGNNDYVEQPVYVFTCIGSKTWTFVKQLDERDLCEISCTYIITKMETKEESKNKGIII